MSELAAIVARARAFRAQGRPFLLATVVRVQGSAYRRPGARMIVGEAGPSAGSVSAGCLERDIVRRGFWSTRNDEPVRLTYDGTSDDEVKGRLGLGCDGVVEVLVERPSARDACNPIAAIEQCVAEERPVAMATVFESRRDDLRVGQRVVLNGRTEASTLIRGVARDDLLAAARRAMTYGTTTAWSSLDGGVHALVEILMPAPHLFVFGAGDDAVPVVAFAKALGWSVTVCDRQARFSTQERFVAADRVLVVEPDASAALLARHARPLAVVLSHDYAYDRDVVRSLAASSALYVGLLGPRRRTDRMLGEIEDEGGPPAAEIRSRLHAPIGLDLGAETPSEVALAIVAEAQAALAGASGRNLRDCDGPVHAIARHDLASAAE